MKTRLFFTSILIAVLFLSCSNEKKETKRPNVLFILVDDLGMHDLGVTGSTFYETPNIDQLANEGTIFTHGYAASRVCSPSRASIFTGQFTARHQITDWIGAASGEQWHKHNRHDKLLPADYNHVLPHDNTTLAEAMKEAGYKTFFAGKWHLGKEGSYPEDHGFDYNVGGWDKGSPIGGYFSPWKNPKLENKTDGENLSMRLAKETAGFIEKNKDSTFFAFLSFYAVHGPIQTTQQKWEKYRKKAEAAGIAENGFTMERVLPIRTQQDNPIYGGLVEAMDDAVGVVLNKLKDLGLDENTIVVFSSDNGGVASGDNYSTSNSPLRGGKGYQWEGGIREPYFIKAPQYKSIREIDYPVIGTDFYPTILDLANIDLKPDEHIDGMSLKPLFEKKAIENRPLYWHYPHYGNQGGEPSSIILKNNFKLIHYYEDGRNELYNLTQDPSEEHNIAKKNIEKTKELHLQLSNWLKSVNANMASHDPEYNAEKDSLRDVWIRSKQLSNLENQRKRQLSKEFEPNANWWKSKVTID